MNNRTLNNWQNQAKLFATKSLAEIDKFWLQKCLLLAKRGHRKNSANPLVGCIIVKNNKIIGCGYHRGSGSDHAEIDAFKNCHESTQNATLYVNLEPCNHHGQTPPCCQEIIKSAISRVVIAQHDPNPLVNGNGISALKNASIKVDSYPHPASENLNRFFNYHIRKKLPYCIGKWAMSLDGKMICHKNDSPQLSSKKAWRNTHLLRQQVDAICVGVDTIINDNPQLSCRINKRLIKQYSPLCLVLDSNGRCPLDAKILQPDAVTKTCIITSNRASASFIDAIEARGHQVMIVNKNQFGLDLKQLLQKLYQQNIYSILVEGGPCTLNSFLTQQLIQETQVYLTPNIIAGLNKKQCLNNLKSIKIGEDIHLTSQFNQ